MAVAEVGVEEIVGSIVAHSKLARDCIVQGDFVAARNQLNSLLPALDAALNANKGVARPVFVLKTQIIELIDTINSRVYGNSRELLRQFDLFFTPKKNVVIDALLQKRKAA